MSLWKKLFPIESKNLATEQVNRWGRPAEELWQVALMNLARQEVLPPPRRYSVSLTEPSASQLAFYHFESDSMFVAAHALRLPAVDTGRARLGWIFMVRNRHTLLFTAIMTLRECGAALLMLKHGLDVLVSRPGLVSDQLFWTDGDRYEHLSRPDGLRGHQIVERLTGDAG